MKKIIILMVILTIIAFAASSFGLTDSNKNSFFEKPSDLIGKTVSFPYPNATQNSFRCKVVGISEHIMDTKKTVSLYIDSGCFFNDRTVKRVTCYLGSKNDYLCKVFYLGGTSFLESEESLALTEINFE